MPRHDELQDAVVHEMVTDILPMLATMIEDAAARAARKVVNDPAAFSAFVEDKAAQELIYELIEFLTQAEVYDDLHLIIHPCQLDERHFFHYYGLPTPNQK